MSFYMVTWKEFSNGKMTDKSALIKDNDKTNAVNKMREFNAQKRLTSTEYSVFDLTELFAKKGLEIKELIQDEDFEDDSKDEAPKPVKKEPNSSDGLNLTVE